MKSVLETRKTPEGMTRRRYEREGLPRLTTYEVPGSVLKDIGMKRVKEAMATWHRGEQMRRRAERTHMLISEGIKPLAIAHDLNVTEDNILRIRRRIRASGKIWDAK